MEQSADRQNRETNKRDISIKYKTISEVGVINGSQANQYWIMNTSHMCIHTNSNILNDELSC